MKTKFHRSTIAILLITLFISASAVAGSAQTLKSVDEIPLLPNTQNEVFFGTTSDEPILSDLNVRKAIAYCTDRWALADAAYPDLTDPEIDDLMMDSFLPSDHWAYTQPTTQYPFNPDQGRTLLEAAGWTVPEGETYRVNAEGEPLAIQLTTTWSDLRYAWGEVFEQQMADCGIWVLRFHTSSSWWFGDYTGLVRRNFEIGGFAWGVEADPQPNYLYGCNQIPSEFNGWQGGNFMGWCNPTASAAAEQASNTSLTQQERIPYFATLQEEFAQDVPSLPLFLFEGSTNWEHIDFNMYTTPSKVYIPVVLHNYQQPSTWVEFSNPITETLAAVDMVSSNDGWAVGGGGVVLHYDGNNWSQVTPPVMANFYSVSMSSSTNGWITGQEIGTYDEVVLRWDGFSWTPVSLPGNFFGASDVSAPDSTTAWFSLGYGLCTPICEGDQGGILNWWDGAYWDQFSTTPLHSGPRSISMVDSTDGWAVGYKYITATATIESSILRWDGTSWTEHSHPNVSSLTAVATSDTSNAWAVGGGGAVLHWNGSEWSVVPISGYPNLNSVDIVSTDDVWTVGMSTIQHWDGFAWEDVTCPVTETLNSVSMASSTEGWAVGDNGTILKYGP